MTFDKNLRTMMGVTIEEAVKILSEAGADIIGTNCGEGVEVVVQAIRQMRSLTTLPLIAEPNAGVPHIEDGATVFDESPQSFANKASALREAGANIIGGCCGTTPAHIKALKEALGL